MDDRNLIQKLFGYCPTCRRWFKRVTTDRQETAYVDDTRNFFTGCVECHETNAEYLEERWEEFFSSVL